MIAAHPEIISLFRYISKQIESGRVDYSPEEYCRRWRCDEEFRSSDIIDPSEVDPLGEILRKVGEQLSEITKAETRR